jgi:uncharacterized protein YndB with AHSA1/START domain
MAKIEASTMVDRPVEEVWVFVTNALNFPKWDKGVIEARQTSTGPVGMGATFEAKTQEFGVLTSRVVEYEPNRKFAYEFSSGSSKGTIATFSMETIEGKSRLNLLLDVKLVGFHRLIGPLVASRMRRRLPENLGNLKRMCESEAQSQFGANEPYTIGFA